MIKVPRIGVVFGRRYDFAALTEFPATDVRCFYYPAASRDAGTDVLIVQVDPAGAERWVGIFAAMDHSAGLPSAIFTCPDSDEMCVVSGGIGHFVHASMPQRSSEVPVVPITDLVQIPESQLLVFADFTNLCAWSRNGLHWRTQRLVWDDLRITHYDDTTISGTGYDPTQATLVQFSVDVHTGRRVDGAFDYDGRHGDVV